MHITHGVAGALLIVLLLTIAAPARAGTIVEFTFDSPVPDNNKTTGSLAASIGSGTASTVGVTQSINYGNTNDLDDSALVATGFPTAAATAGTAGFQFVVSTAGYEAIKVRYSQATHSQAAKDWIFAYSTDGGASFTSSPRYEMSTSTGWLEHVWDLSAVPEVANKQGLVLRILATTGINTGYLPAGGFTYTYNGTKAVRIDDFIVEGTHLPEPLAGTATVGLLSLLLQRRRA